MVVSCNGYGDFHSGMTWSFNRRGQFFMCLMMACINRQPSGHVF